MERAFEKKARGSCIFQWPVRTTSSSTKRLDDLIDPMLLKSDRNFCALITYKQGPKAPATLFLYGSAEAPQQGSTCCQPTRCNSLQSCSAASLRRCTRVFSSGGSPGIGRPVSTKTFGSLAQLFSSRWNRLVSLVARSWMMPSLPTAHA